MLLKNRSQNHPPEDVNSNGKAAENQGKILKEVLSAEMKGISTLLQELRGAVDNNQKATLQLRKEFQEMSNQQTAQQKLFDTLHSELCDYKDDFIFARMKPLIVNMLFLYDSLKSFDEEMEQYVEPPDWLGAGVLTKGVVSSNLVHFHEQLGEMVKMCGLTEVSPEINTAFDAKIQNSVATAPTEDPNLDNHIHKVIKSGWLQDNKLFRPAEVSIWKIA